MVKTSKNAVRILRIFVITAITLLTVFMVPPSEGVVAYATVPRIKLNVESSGTSIISFSYSRTLSMRGNSDSDNAMAELSQDGSIYSLKVTGTQVGTVTFVLYDTETHSDVLQVDVTIVEGSENESNNDSVSHQEDKHVGFFMLLIFVCILVMCSIVLSLLLCGYNSDNSD